MKWQRGSGLMRQRRWLLPALIIGGLLFLWVMYRAVSSWFDAPDPTTIAEASLQSMREQNRMIVLSSQLTSTQTTQQRRGPFTYSRTLIMPGDVRYELDMAKLDQEGLRWDAESKTLSVTLPPLEVSQPQIDPRRVREIGDGGILRGIIVDDETLDQANMQAGLRELAEQARQPSLMRVARANAKRVIARNFAMPLRAAGVEANVEVRFADEPRDEPSYMDGSRPLNEVMGRPVSVNGQ
jgi:hypothetical protein